jgi:hypothetical protein
MRFRVNRRLPFPHRIMEGLPVTRKWLPRETRSLNDWFGFIFNCYNRGSFYVRHGSGKMSSTTIHWGRILLGGLLAEVALFLAIVPLAYVSATISCTTLLPPDPSSCAS